MLLSAIILWGTAALLAVIVLRRPGRRFPEALRHARGNAVMVLPRIPIAIIAAGFLAELMPQEAISTWIGAESGLVGILIASAIGAVIPSGPIISFPVAIALLHLGAGVPQLVAFLTAWSVFAVHRLLMWEIPLLGMGFAAKRLLASLVLPPIAALIAVLILSV
jgi:uncharacterized membrane protein YraQ (UPF0718 family)